MDNFFFSSFIGNARGQTSQQICTILKASVEAFTSLIIVVPIKYKNDFIAIAFYIFICKYSLVIYIYICICMRMYFSKFFFFF
jgi:hypothetical protein